jgi:endoglucanase
LGQTWPGLLVGGANYASQENPRVDEDTLPGLAWFDKSDDYSTNEVAINWNAALVYALAATRMPLEGWILVCCGRVLVF